MTNIGNSGSCRRRTSRSHSRGRWNHSISRRSSAPGIGTVSGHVLPRATTKTFILEGTVLRLIADLLTGAAGPRLSTVINFARKVQNTDHLRDLRRELDTDQTNVRFNFRKIRMNLPLNIQDLAVVGEDMPDGLSKNLNRDPITI